MFYVMAICLMAVCALIICALAACTVPIAFVLVMSRGAVAQDGSRLGAACVTANCIVV